MAYSKRKKNGPAKTFESRDKQRRVYEKFFRHLPRGKHIDASFPLFAKVQLQVSRLRLTMFAGMDFTNGYSSSNVNHGARCQ